MSYALYTLAGIWLLWVMYLAVMNLMRVRDLGALTRPAYWLGMMTVLIPGYVLDCLINIGPMSLLLAEVPREWTVSARVERHCKEGRGYRYAVCMWMRLHLLAPFDPSGRHG